MIRRVLSPSYFMMEPPKHWWNAIFARGYSNGTFVTLKRIRVAPAFASVRSITVDCHLHFRRNQGHFGTEEVGQRNANLPPKQRRLSSLNYFYKPIEGLKDYLENGAIYAPPICIFKSMMQRDWLVYSCSLWLL